MSNREECVRLMLGIVKDIKSHIKNPEIMEKIYQMMISISVGLDFSDRGNGSLEEFREYGWHK